MAADGPVRRVAGRHEFQPGQRVIVVGFSAGGLSPFVELVRGLPAKLPASIFVVRHFPDRATCNLPLILSHHTSLAVEHARHGESVTPGKIYIAPPGQHLMLVNGRVERRYGPRVNFVQPSIDVLFRSAAREYGPAVIGILLSGGLDDGVAGLLAIQRAGGVAIVQDPNESEVSGMPGTAAHFVQSAYVRPVQAMPGLIAELLGEFATAQENAPMRDPMDKTTEKTERDMVQQMSGERNGSLSVFSCPDCGGVLWQVDDERLVQFRCHVGHIYSGGSLLEQKQEALEKSIWYTIRALKEVVMLSTQLANAARQRRDETSAFEFERQARRAEKQLTDLESAVIAGGEREES